jgi:hypothetical protein
VLKPVITKVVGGTNGKVSLCLLCSTVDDF